LIIVGIEIWGEWWLPDQDERLSGRLEFDRVDGGELTLIGDFSDLSANTWSRPALFGESFDGEKLTLLEPFWRNRPLNISGLILPPNRTFVGSLTLVRGAHVESAEAFEIRRAVIRLQGLRALCLQPPIPLVGIKHGFIGPGEDESTERTVEVDGGTLTFAYETFETRSRFGRTLEEDVEVRLELDATVGLEEFEEEWLLPLQGLVIFAGREPTVLESLIVVQPSDVDVHPLIRRASSQVKWDEQRIEVITQLPGLIRQPRSDYERSLVPFAALEEEATGFIRRWWTLHQKLGKDVMWNAPGAVDT
jgi:ApeA N-terminal domain 1